MTLYKERLKLLGLLSSKVSELDLLLNEITDTNTHNEVLKNDSSVGNESW